MGRTCGAGRNRIDRHGGEIERLRYVWAEVMSADAFAAFEEAGLDDEAAVSRVGRQFRDTVLALGGGEHPTDVCVCVLVKTPANCYCSANVRRSSFVLAPLQARLIQ